MSNRHTHHTGGQHSDGQHSAGQHSADQHPAGEPGVLIRWPRRYDLLAAVVFAGRGRRVRAQIADAMQLQRGQRVLDVGCGTGTLALALAQRVGIQGRVQGVDASEEMISAAQGKAARKKVAAHFAVATAQALPFDDGYFDAVVTSLMIHHLPDSDRPAAAHELLRVLRPGGRLLIAEFQAPAGPTSRRVTAHHFGAAMATHDINDVLDLVAAAGAVDVSRQATSVGWLGLVAGRKPALAGPLR
jgi:ubiquinone/menaquinone biosynthesis C-methylase UbiE